MEVAIGLAAVVVAAGGVVALVFRRIQARQERQQRQ
jgi:hypothetical protein